MINAQPVILCGGSGTRLWPLTRTIVLTRTAEITNGYKVLTLTENQSTYNPLGEVHRLTNPGTTPLEIIEVQSGGYLGAEDIMRFKDAHGRIK